MAKNTIIWVGVAVLVVIIGVAVWMSGSSTMQGASSEKQGRVVVALTDAAANMSNVSEVKFKVDSVELHSATQGWVEVSGSSHEYNLLKLRDSNRWALVAQGDVAADTYNQVRLNVDSVTVVTSDGQQHDAKLPSGELKINGQFVVNASTSSSLTMDVLADQSLHLTGSGKYIFAPVVKVESRSNAEVNVSGNGTASEDDDSVRVSSGTVNTSVAVGMDLNGEVKNNFKVDSGVKLDIDAGGEIKLLNSSGGLKINMGGSSDNGGSGSVDANSNAGSDSSGGGVKVNVGGSGVIKY